MYKTWSCTFTVGHVLATCRPQNAPIVGARRMLVVLYAAVGVESSDAASGVEASRSYIAMNGRNTTDHCDKLFADVGANTGQSLHQWYHSSDAGHGMS